MRTVRIRVNYGFWRICGTGINGSVLTKLEDRVMRVTICIGSACHLKGSREIIQRLHAVHVHTHALLAQKGRQLRVAAAPLVAGHIKGHHPHFAELFQRFIDGRTVLVQPEPCSVLTHVFPPSLIPMQTKKRKYRTKSADLRFEKHLNAPPKTPGRNTRVQRPLRMIQKRRDYESLYSNSAFTALY